MSLIQVVKFRTWETRLSKMPRFGTPTRVTTASGLCWVVEKMPQINFSYSHFTTMASF